MIFGSEVEIAVKLGLFRNVGIKQPCVLRIRLSIHHRNPKGGVITAVPLSVFSVGKEPTRSAQSELNHADSTCMTAKIPIRFQDCVSNINEICIFKSTVDASEPQYKSTKLILLAQLLLVEGDQVRTLIEYQAVTGELFVHGYLPILFDNLEGKYTCSLEIQLHSQLLGFRFLDSSSQIQARDREQLGSGSKERQNTRFQSFRQFLRLTTNNHQKEEIQRFYDRYVGELRQTVYNLKSFLKDFIELLDQSKEGLTLGMGVIRKLSEPLGDPAHFTKLKKRQPESLKESINIITGSFHKKSPSTSICDVLLSPESVEESLLKDFNVLSNVLYQLWRQYLKLEGQFHNHLYRQQLKSKYFSEAKRQVISDHCSFEGLKKNMPEPSILQDVRRTQNIYHCSPNVLDCSKYVKPAKKHLVVLVHGLHACSLDMDMIRTWILHLFPKCEILMSTANQNRTQKSIQLLGERLGKEVKDHINSLPDKAQYKVSFIAHSLGGLIVRSALQYLQFYKGRFGFFVSLSSPHLGYLFHTSTLIQTSLWVLNKMNKFPSLLELSFEDKPTTKECYLYRLSQLPGLENFQCIILQSSSSDEYVPYSSARFETCTQVSKDPNSANSICYKQMLDNVMCRLDKNKIVRVNVEFTNLEKDFNTIIGRTPHIQMLMDALAMKAFLMLISDVFV